MKMSMIFRPKNVWSMLVVFIVIFLVFLLSPHQARAGNASEYIWFVVDTELDVRNAKDDTHVVTVNWSCESGLSGSITDNTASEGNGVSIKDNVAVRDGIIKVASSSTEMTNAGCSFKSGDTVRASVSLDGWLTRTTEYVMAASTSYSTYFGAGASMDYDLVVGLVKEELGNTLALDGSTASVSYSGTTASSSYSSNYKYIAATADGTVRAGGDGYVNKEVSITWAGTGTDTRATASKSADFSSATVSTYNGDPLPFAVKVTLNGKHNSGATETNITGATVVAGDAGDTACTDSSGTYYCAVLLAKTGTSASVSALHGLNQTLSCTYTDRSSGDDAQSTCTINATETAASGSGGGGYVYTTPTSTPTVTPTPTPVSTPVPTPTPTSTQQVSPLVTRLYRETGDSKVYVQKGGGALTWVKTLEEFNSAGYKWSDVKVVSKSEFSALPVSRVSVVLYRKANDPKIYVAGADGTLTWVKTLAEFNAAGYNWTDVKVISGSEFAKLKINGKVKVVNTIAFLRIRSGPSTSYGIVGQLSPNQEVSFTQIDNGWYKISSGWVSGVYAEEF